MSITPEEEKFAPVSLLDELGITSETKELTATIVVKCEDCLLQNPGEGHMAHCAGEGTDFDA